MGTRTRTCTEGLENAQDKALEAPGRGSGQGQKAGCEPDKDNVLYSVQKRRGQGAGP